MNKTPYILDPACGSRMFWFDKQNSAAVFGDKRVYSDTLCDGRELNIAPDLQMDYTALPFNDGIFRLVVFDPPHLRVAGVNGWQFKKYGVLTKDWKTELYAGFAECFRVLTDYGVLIFKWNDYHILVKEILKLTSYKPLFGHKSGKRVDTHWICFMKMESPR